MAKEKCDLTGEKTGGMSQLCRQGHIVSPDTVPRRENF